MADCLVAIGQLRKRAEKVAGAVASLKAKYKPREASDEMVGAIWAWLPADSLKLQQLYQEAARKGDFATCDAIEKLPVSHPAFDGEAPVDREMLAAWRQDRLRTEEPELAGRIEAAEEDLAYAERAIRAVAGEAASWRRW
jgi:hypothetical protein